MKKIFVLTISLTISAVLFAQTDAKFGIKAGLNVASTNNTSSGQTGSKAGLNAGFLAHIHLTPVISLQPEIYYSNQGGKSGDINLNLNYINIPVLVQYNFDNGFRLQTGPQVGLLVDVNDKTNGRDYNIINSDDFKSTDFSWSFGLGYLTYSGFGIDGRYNLGISKINDDPTREGKTTNRVFQIGLFYLFDHTHKAHSR
jgi:hypothetical protein